MPLTKADREQIDSYIRNNQPHLARLILQDHLKTEPFDETAQKALKKINARYPNSLPAVQPTAPAPIKTAPKPKSVAAASASAEDEIAEIKQAIREKRYDDAEALLVLSDHPEAEKIRERLTSIRGGGGEKSKRTVPEKDFSTKYAIAVILIFIAFIPGLIAFEIFAGEARQYPDAPYAQKIIQTRRNILILLAIILTLLCSLWAISARLAHLAYEQEMHSYLR